MPYEVLGTDVTIPKSLSVTKNPDGSETHDHVSRVYTRGSVVKDEDVSPVLVKLYEDGDEHVTSLLRYVDEEEVDKLSQSQNAAKVRENEAAAADANLGPYPLDVGVTGKTAAPGVIDPAAAAVRADLEVAQGYTPGTVAEGELEVPNLPPEKLLEGSPHLRPSGDEPVLAQSEGVLVAEGASGTRNEAASAKLDEKSADAEESSADEAKEAKASKAEAKKQAKADADAKANADAEKE